MKILLLGVFLFLVPACDQASPQTPSLAELRRKTGEGEQCLVCGELVHGDEVVELRYKGRRFYVATKWLAELRKDPDRYFNKLQPRSALFDEEAYQTAAPTPAGWLYFGLYVLVGLLCAAVCGYLAVNRGLRPIPWFLAGLVGNVLGVLALLCLGSGDPATAVAGIPKGLAKVPTTHNPRPCTSCAHLNHPSAAACAQCGQLLQPTAQSEVTRASSGGRR